MKIKLLLIIALALTACGKRSMKLRSVEHGLYARADSKAGGAMVDDNPMNRVLGETGVRFLGGEGDYKVEDSPDGSLFTVRQAPKGYSDTIGRVFHSKEVKCGNWMD